MEMRGSIKTFIVTQAKKAVRFCPSPEGWVQFHDGQRVVCEQEKSVKKTVAQLSGKGEKATTAAPGQPAPTPAESSPPPTAATTSPPPAPSVAQPEPQPPSGTILSEEAAREHKRKLELFESEYNAKQAELTKQFEAELAKLRQEQAMLEQDRIRTATVLKETENLQRERQEHLDALSAQRKKYDVLVLNYNALQRASTALQTDLELEKTRTRGLADQLQRASSGATLPSSVDLALRERLAAIKEEQAIVQTQLQSEKARVLALEKEHLAMADQHAFLKSQNADMSQELYSIRLERDSLCEKIAELESQLAKVELARESDKISERTHFMEAEQGFSSHIKDIVEVSKAKDVQIQELNAQLSQLKSQIAALEQGNADVVSLQSQLKTAHEQNTELRSQMSDLINARSRLQTRDAEIADLNTKLASAEATISALREEVGTQKRKHDEREEDMIALDEELKSSRDKYSKLQSAQRDFERLSSSERDSQAERLRVFEAQQKETQTLHQEELRKLGEQVANAKLENHDLMVRLREKDEVYDNTKHKLDSTKARVQQLEQELSAAQAKQRVAEEAIAGRLANAESRVEELETTVAQLCRERDDALSRLKHLQAECDTLHEQRSQLERQLSESMDRQQQLTGELKSAREELTPFLKLSGVPSSPPSETTTVTEAEGGEQPSSITPQPLPFDQSLRSSG